MTKFLIYGATGYTGKLIAREAARRGFQPTLAGRNPEKVAAIAGECGLDHSAFELSDTAALEAAISRHEAVLHVAGPFSATAKPMVDACLKTGTHYMDITGEFDVLEATIARGNEAGAAGVMLMSGVAFDVVPTDCLALHVAARISDPTHLTLAIKSNRGGASRGTMKSGVESMWKGPIERRDGHLVAPKGSLLFDVAGAGEPATYILMRWGDLVTAYQSTGIANIRVGFEARPELRKLVELPAIVRFMMRFKVIQAMTKRAVDRGPEGPTEEQLETGRTEITGIAENAKGDRAVSVLTVPQPHKLSAITAVEIAHRVANGAGRPGYLTPGQLFGADFITEFEGCSRVDIV